MDVNAFPLDVRLELSDPLYNTRTHGKKPTYQAGCRGPLCRENERLTKNKEYRARAADQNRRVRRRRPSISPEEAELLQEIMEWHYRQRDLERREARGRRPQSAPVVQVA